MPKRSWAPPRATRKPVITSSKISTLPAFVQQSRRVSRKPGTGGTQFMLPATGSTITAAISPARASNAARTAWLSLNGSTSVSAATAAGTPAESGLPSVSRPEPAFTSSASTWPW